MEIKEISSAFYLSRNTVRKYVRTFQESGLSLEKVLGMSDEHLYGMFVGGKSRTGEPSERRAELDALLPKYAARLRQKGVTVRKLFEKYSHGYPEGYRHKLFERTEADYLRPLLAVRYQMKERRTATIMHNSYVTLFKHHYSVPKEYIGKRVDIVYNSETLEIFHGLRHVATHYRDDTPYGYTQKTSHNLPGRHGSYEKDLGEIFQRAASIDNIVLVYLKEVAAHKRYLPIAFRSCRGILSLERRFGLERLVSACACASHARLYGYQDVLGILERGGNYAGFLPSSEDCGTDAGEPKLSRHKNIRGREYFSKTNISNNLKADSNENK